MSKNLDVEVFRGQDLLQHRIKNTCQMNCLIYWIKYYDMIINKD